MVALGAQQGDQLLNGREHALFLGKAVMGSEVDGDQEERTKPCVFDDHREPIGAVHGHMGGGWSLDQSLGAQNQEACASPLHASVDVAITPGDAVT